MAFIDNMRKRYTTKKYDSSKSIPSEKIEALKEILLLSPSSINSQPWKFTFVSDQSTKEQLSRVSWHNTEKVLNCDTVVVFSKVNSIEAFEQDIQERLAEGAVNYYKEFVQPLSDELIHAWFEKQVYLSLGVFLSACANMEIDSTPMEGIEPEKYDEVLDLQGYNTIVAVAIGHRDPDDFNQPIKKPKTRKNMTDVITSL